MSQDITFCTYYKCPNRECMRHHSNIEDYRIPHSFSEFTECLFFKKEEKKK